MAATIQLLVVDLSQWNVVTDWVAMKAAGIVGVIYKATQGKDYQDPSYPGAAEAAKAAGLLWGGYHFGDGSDVGEQARNFVNYAQLTAGDLLALDFEDYDSQMEVAGARQFIVEVEEELGRRGECVLYSGNTVKDQLATTVDSFLGARRLWLAEYGSNPVVQASWASYWLWQYTDQETVAGISGMCDGDSYAGTAGELAREWAAGPEPEARSTEPKA